MTLVAVTTNSTNQVGLMPRSIQGVCFTVITDPFVLQAGYSALKPMIKYQTLSL